ncbi:MAG: sel1 repeat family protein [Rhodocyclales bacterium GT-UBC]|nr:MAG: sel1 repeat family protein [Rhodocyclales bacterium GT-UBC]
MRKWSRIRSSLGAAFWLGSFLLLAANQASAGPAEEYEAGLKSFQVGDIVGAMNPLRSAANAGHAKAQVLLAEILDRSEFDEDAVALYRKAAEQGDADGMFGLGTMIVAGEGVDKKDVPAGRAWIQKAADLGHQQATRVIAQAYLKGELGFSEAECTSPIALHWVKQAAETDYLPAIDALASAYALGNQWGIEANKAIADQYLAQANRIRNIDAAKAKKKARRVVASPN